MLVNKINKTIELIDDVQYIESNIDKYKKYTNVKEKIEEVNNETSDYSDKFELLNVYKAKYFIKEKLIDEISLVYAIKNKINNNEIPTNTEINEISIKLKEKRIRLNEKWKNYVNELSNDTLNILVLIQDLDESNEDIEKIKIKINNISENKNLDNNVLKKLDETLTKAKSIIETLNIKEDVQNFLQRASEKEARLEDVTPEILKWFNEHGFANKIKVSF